MDKPFSLKGLLILCLVAAPASAAPGRLVKESVDVLPPGWTYRGAPPPSDVLKLSFALRHDGMSILKRRLDVISDPSSAEYGHHLTLEETTRFRTPAAATTGAVLNWLAGHGVQGAKVEGDLVHVKMSASQTTELLDAELAYYSFGDTGGGAGRLLRARSYALPADVASYVDFVHPLTNFMPPRQRRQMPAQGHVTSGSRHRRSMKKTARPCSNGTTPSCIRELYNFHYRPESDCVSPARLAVGGFLEEHMNYDDLHRFLEQHAPDVAEKGYNLTVELINGANNSQTPEKAGVEAALDVQYAVALSHPVRVSYISTGGRGTKIDANGVPSFNESDNEPWVEFLQHLLSKPARELPHVISLSYSDDEQSVPATYARYVCDMFAALAARGVSVFVSSGDGGANGVRPGSCLSNDGLERKIAMPTFPPSCPYVTAVGAVKADDGSTTGTEFSNGGFSELFPRQGWQEDQVQQYMTSLHGILNGHYNESGRATPDLAAVGTAFAIQVDGTSNEVVGTSASTPVVAAMFAAINDARLRAGMNVTGWLNPRLYAIDTRGLIEDVRLGVSLECAWGGETAGGWPAALGFDCVTGLGVPSNFEILLDAFLQN